MTSAEQIAGMRRYAPWILMLAGIAVAIASYLQALHYPFVNDDTVYIVENFRLAGLHFTELWRLFFEPYNRYEFLPLRDLSYWFDITLFGLTPAVFRVHNIILYLCCLPLVYAATLALWRYFRPADSASAPWAAAATTALFVLHPAHAEAVVWISGRKDMLSALFSLLALWFALSAKRERGLSAGHASATLVALLAAMLSKATSVALAPVIALLWIFFWQDMPRPDRNRTMLLWPLASLVLAACTVLVFSAHSAVKAAAYFGPEVATRALAVLGWLGRLAVSPENRYFHYPVFDDPYLPVMVTFGAAIFLAAIAGAVQMTRKRTLEGFALVAFVLLCLPYTQLVPFVTPTLVSDRFLTFATWPAILLLVALAWRFKNIVPRMLLLLALALSWSYQTVERPRDWRSYEALMDADLRAYPGYYLPAFQKIMSYLLPKGRFREAGELADSISVPEARAIMQHLVLGAIDLRDVAKTRDPRAAEQHLQELGILLKNPPVQYQWDPAIVHFWEESQDSFELEWQWLVRSFPDDASVRESAAASLTSVLKKYQNAEIQ